MAKSLLDGIDVQEKSGKKSSGGGMSADPKLFVAIGLLVLAVGILVYWYALRGDGPAPEFTAEQIQEAETYQQEQIKQAEQTGAQLGGS